MLKSYKYCLNKTEVYFNICLLQCTDLLLLDVLANAQTLIFCPFVFCSELFEVNHIRTIYHMFIALLILFILSTLVVDFIDEGR